MSSDARLEELQRDLARLLGPAKSAKGTAGGRGREADHPGEIPPRGWKDILWRAWGEVSEQNLFLIAGWRHLRGFAGAVPRPGGARFALRARVRRRPDRAAGGSPLRGAAGADAGTPEPATAQSGAGVERRARLCR